MRSYKGLFGNPGTIKFVRAIPLILVTGVAWAWLPAWAGPDTHKSFNNSHLKGAWVMSGMLRVAVPVPLPGTLIQGAPPHDPIAPGDVAGLWASILGTITFDGAGTVSRVEDVIKIGGLKPVSPPVPFDYLPPLPEVYTGNYTVSEHGVVNIELTGRTRQTLRDRLISSSTFTASFSTGRRKCDVSPRDSRPLLSTRQATRARSRASLL